MPHGAEPQALEPLWPAFLSYVLSFVYIGIYWNNHHRMLQTVREVNGTILWANLHLLFWLSLLPFTAGWMGEKHFARLPTALYGINTARVCAGDFVLQGCLVRHQGPHGPLAKAIAPDAKGQASPLLYVLGIAATWFITPWAGLAFFVAVALMW